MKNRGDEQKTNTNWDRKEAIQTHRDTRKYLTNPQNSSSKESLKWNIVPYKFSSWKNIKNAIISKIKWQ